MPLRLTLEDVLLIAVWRVGFGREQLIAWVDRVLVVQCAIKGGVLHTLPRGREQTAVRLNIETGHRTQRRQAEGNPPHHRTQHRHPKHLRSNKTELDWTEAD